MTVPTYKQPNVTGDSPSEYVANIDASTAVMAQVAALFAAHEQSTPNMTVRVDAGRMMIAGVLTSVAAQSTGTITAPSTNPRIDRVTIDPSDGSLNVTTGTEAASPTAPSLPAGDIPCCQVLLQTSSTSITNSMITDERVLSPLDRYEEGTWTPTLQDGSLSDAEGQTYNVNTGLYVRTGRIVFIEFYLSISGLGTLSGDAAIANLPYNAAAGSILGGITINLASNLNITANTNIGGAVVASSNHFLLRNWDATTGPTILQISEITSSGILWGSGFYFV